MPLKQQNTIKFYYWIYKKYIQTDQAEPEIIEETDSKTYAPKPIETDETPKKAKARTKTITPSKEDTPKKTIPKKSAFDFLMSKKKPPQLVEVERQMSENDFIVLDSSTCGSPCSKDSSPFFVVGDKKSKSNATTYQFKHVIEDFPSKPLFLTHQLQYNG